jgi:glycosyltransferase involved in cell wall biosynthesis
VIIPTGVDVDFYKPVEPLQDEQNLVFGGHYRHYPNADAIIYFVNEIYGKVLKALPDIKLYIVGSGLTKEVSALAGKNKNIVITGEVEDIRQYLKKPNIFIAPIRLGGGIKGKVLEAMAAGVPVIATNEAVDGIDHNMSEAILSGDDADVFASNIIKLVKNKALYNTISKNARIIAEQYYDWKKISQALNDFYSDKIKKL